MFPRQANQRGGWTIDLLFLQAVQAGVNFNHGGDESYCIPREETIEIILLAAERILPLKGKTDEEIRARMTQYWKDIEEEEKSGGGRGRVWFASMAAIRELQWLLGAKR